jgi:hypothetical protein
MGVWRGIGVCRLGRQMMLLILPVLWARGSRVDLFTISEYATKAKHAEFDEGPVPINQTWVLHATNRPSWWIRSGAHPNARRCT